MASMIENLIAPLELWAQKTPDAVALEDVEGRKLTYQQLEAAASQLAAKLHGMGVRKGDRVGICMPKSLNSVTCIMGILKARAAYIPVDYSAPWDRNCFIFENCQAKVICADEPRSKALATGGSAPAPMLIFPGDANDGFGAGWLNEQSAAWRSPEPFSQDELSYILYTSGSTGKPKGVVHTHRSATSFVNWCVDTFKPTAKDRFSSHAPFHFDLSILDLYTPAAAGAALVIVGEELGKQPHTLGQYIADRKISVWYSVPSILALLAEFGKLETYDFSSLRTVLFAGEVFPVKHLRELVKKWPGRDYYNLYGPTETNVCTYYKVPNVIPEDRTTPFPIGKVCENCRDVVLDEEYKPVGGNDEGLLWIHQSGPVMKEYWNLPEMNAKAFYTDPQGQRWYRTGDVVFKDENGDYIFVGRRDRMVKRRGYRIELGEIEAGLYKNKSIREAAVVARDGADGVVITAYVAPVEGQKLSIISMKQFCNQNIITYMNPDKFVFLDKLPRTSTDKIDYQSLMKLPG